MRIGARWGTGAITKADIARYAFELVVVFVGVYLAFVLTDYQEELRDREIRIKYYEALIREFQVLILHLDEEDGKLRAHLAVVELVEQGERPHLPASDLYYTYPGAVLSAAFDGPNFESLDPGVLRNLVQGAPALRRLEQAIRAFSELSATVLLPMQANDQDCCYDSDGALRRELAWYPRLVREIHAVNRQLRSVLSERAIPNLEETKTKMEQQFRWPV